MNLERTQTAKRPGTYRWRRPWQMLALSLVLGLGLVHAQVPPGFPGGAPGGASGGQPGFPGGPGFGGMGADRLALVEQFDADGSGFLEAAERAAAKEYLASIGWNTAQRRGPGGSGGAGGGATAEAGIELTPEDVEAYPDASFYDTAVVRTIFIEFDEDDWEAEMEVFYNTDVELPATVTVDGVEYENVGVRFRGNSSYSMVASGLKRPLRLKFDTVTSGQNVQGVRTVKLLNGINDASNLRTVLTSDILQDYIAVPKVNFVRVVINGENWGIYQNQQHFNRDFLSDWYGESDGVRWEVEGSPNGQGGMLYLGDDPDLYRGIYSIDNRDTEASWAALSELFRVLTETPLDGLVEALEPMLDIEGTLRFLALDVALVNSDGFWARASDYELYLDASGVFHIINHDINETMSTSGGMFGGRGRSGGGSSGVQLDPLVGLNDAATPLRSRLLAVPELQKRYLEIMLEVTEKWLDWDTLGPLAQQYHALIDADMAVDTKALSTYAQFQASLESIRSFVEARQAYLLEVLPGLIAGIDVPAYAPAAEVATTASATSTASPETAASQTQALDLGAVSERAYQTQDGPSGWYLTAGTGAVWALAAESGDVTTAFAFTDLTEGFGDNKLDQCVPLTAGQGLAIALEVLPVTGSADASGLALRVNPNFHDSLAACLGALENDSGSSRLNGGRNDDDLDHPFGAGDGGQWTALDAAVLPELAYAAADIPEGASYLRLSLRARDRSGSGDDNSVLVTNVSVVHTPGGAEAIVNGDFSEP